MLSNQAEAIERPQTSAGEVDRTFTVLIRVLEPGRWRYISCGLAEDRPEKQDGVRKMIAYQWLRGDVLLVNTTPAGVRRSHAS